MSAKQIVKELDEGELLFVSLILFFFGLMFNLYALSLWEDGEMIALLPGWFGCLFWFVLAKVLIPEED